MSKRRRNPVSPRTSGETLYRSVSPEEMIDIVRTGRITGRGNMFVDDPRTTLVLFGHDDAKSVVYHGEDARRQVRTSPKYIELFSALNLDHDEIVRKLRRFEKYNHDGDMLVPLREQAEHMKLQRALSKIHASHRKILEAIGKDAAKARDANRKRFGATSFVVELDGVPGGTLFHGHGPTDGSEYNEAQEVGFPRDPGVPDRYITRVHVVADGKIADVLPYADFKPRLLAKAAKQKT